MFLTSTLITQEDVMKDQNKNGFYAHSRPENRPLFKESWFKRTAFLAAAAALPGAVTSCSDDGESGGVTKTPNVVLIFTDDQGYADLSSYGSTDISTPNIDGLADEGVKFTNFYASAPVCTPSRAGLMTGCYPKRIEMGNGVCFPNDQFGMNPSEVTIADMLKGRDYTTKCIGKWHLGRPNEVLPTSQGFDSYYGIPYSNDMTPDHPYQMYLGGPWPNLPLMENETVIDEGVEGSYGIDQTYLTVKYTEKAVEFIEENKGRPFFLYMAHNQPHFPNYFSPDWAGTSSRGRYGDAVQEIDWSVGQVLAALEENGLDDDTIVIYTSDNGPWKFVLDMAPDAMGNWSASSDGSTGSALPLFGWKGETYEGGQRVPCIMRFPESIPAGTVTDGLASNMDILPTIAEYTGIDISQNPVIDGKSVKTLVENPETASSPHKYFLYYDGDGEVLRAIRDSAGYKLQLQDEQGNEVNELYYLPEDISSTRNIADYDPQKVRELQNAADSLNSEITSGIRPRWSNETEEETKKRIDNQYRKLFD